MRFIIMMILIFKEEVSMKSKIISTAQVEKYRNLMKEMYLRREFIGRDICDEFKVNNVIPYTLHKRGVLDKDGNRFMWNFKEYPDGADKKVVIEMIMMIRRHQRALREKKRKGNSIEEAVGMCGHCKTMNKLGDLMWDYEKGRICEKCLLRKRGGGVLKLREIEENGEQKENLFNNKDVRIREAIKLLKGEGFKIYKVREEEV